MSTRPKMVSVTAYSCTAATGSLIRLYQTPRQAARSRSRRSRRPSTPVPGWNRGGASTGSPRQPPEQAAVQRAEPPGHPQPHGDQQQADDGADDGRRHGEAGRQQHHGDHEADHPRQPAEDAVQQLTTSPAGERGTKDDARHPPELGFHRPYCPRYASRRASAQVPAARAAAAYTHSMPNPRPGDRVCALRLDRGQRVLRDQHGHELADRVLDRGAQRQQDEREHEQHPDHGRDRRGRVPDDGAQAEGDERDQRRGTPRPSAPRAARPAGRAWRAGPGTAAPAHPLRRRRRPAPPPPPA